MTHAPRAAHRLLRGAQPAARGRAAPPGHPLAHAAPQRGPARGAGGGAGLCRAPGIGASCACRTHEADLRSQIQAFQRALKRQLDGADYDVVHCRDVWSAIPVLEAKPRLGYAVVYDLTRSPLGETTCDSELDAQYTRDEETCVLGADMVLAPTPAAVKALQGRGKPERVVLRRRAWTSIASTGSTPQARGPRASSTPARSIRARRARARARDGRDRPRGGRAPGARGLDGAEVRSGAARRHPRALPERQDRGARAGRSRSDARADRDRPRCAWCRPRPI